MALLLEVGDNALADEVGRPDDLKNFIVLLLGKCQFEPVLGRVDIDRPGSTGAVDAVNDLTLDASEVDRLLERLDNARVTGGEGVLDVVEGRVDEDTCVVPGG